MYSPANNKLILIDQSHKMGTSLNKYLLTWSTVHPGQILENLGPEWLRESTVGLPCNR